MILLYTSDLSLNLLYIHRHNHHVKLIDKGAGRSSEVERSIMVRWVVGSILHGVSIELFLVPASVIKAVVCVILSVG